MTTDRYYRIKEPDVLHEAFDNEVVLINLEDGNYYSLQGVAAMIWNFIAKNLSPEGIVEQILLHYTGDHDEIALSVNNFFAELLEDGLIEKHAPAGQEVVFAAEANLPAEGANDLPVFSPPILERYTDMQDLLLLDPIHDVDEKGWPNVRTNGTSAQ